jgi:Ca-activated chloride channel family protein
MFALGIDQAVNAAFLRRLAGAGGGLCELVESEDRLDAVMAKVHRRIGTPVATELRMFGTGFELEASTVAPSRLPDVYAGAPVTIFGRYRGSAANAAVDLEGTTFGDPLRMRIARDAEGGVRAAAPWLAASWARARIRDLEDRYATGERGPLEPEIVALSKRYGVLSRFTAFLAIDRSEVANRSGRLAQVVQPVESPAGWENASYGGVQRQSMAMPMKPRPAPASIGMPMSAPPAMPMAQPPPPPSGAFSMGNARPPAPGYAPRQAGGSAPPPASGYAPADRPPRPTEAAPMGPPPADEKTARERAVAPPAAPAARRVSTKDKAERALGEASAGAAPTPGSAYLEALAALARDLEAQGRGRADAAAIRLLRQRLTEWIEDVRSVGGHAALADAVEHLVQRLSAALAAGQDPAGEAVAIAAELARYAAGGAPRPAPKPGRAFWK